MFTQIHDILYYGNGGYDYTTVYNMPLWLRKFTYQKIAKYKQAEADAMKGNSSNSGTTNIDMANPDKSKIPDRRTISPPTYVTRASKK